MDKHKYAHANAHITHILCRSAAAVLCFQATGGFDIVSLRSVWYEEWPECVEGKRSDSPGGQLVLSSPLLEFRQVPWCWEINEAALALWSLQDTHTHTIHFGLWQFSCTCTDMSFTRFKYWLHWGWYTHCTEITFSHKQTCTQVGLLRPSTIDFNKIVSLK